MPPPRQARPVGQARLRRSADQGAAAAFRLLRGPRRHHGGRPPALDLRHRALLPLRRRPRGRAAADDALCRHAVGRVPVVPYTRPGSADVAPLIWAKAAAHAGILLGNHGPVVAGASLEAAVFAIEELEEAAKLAILTSGFNIRYLDAAEITDLEETFKPR